MKIYWFTRFVFELTQSLFVLDATGHYHLHNYIGTLEELLKQVIEDFHVDYLVTGRE